VDRQEEVRRYCYERGCEAMDKSDYASRNQWLGLVKQIGEDGLKKTLIQRRSLIAEEDRNKNRQPPVQRSYDTRVSRAFIAWYDGEEGEIDG
jgi:hypothetical protein